jgi:hypothetical protein
LGVLALKYYIETGDFRTAAKIAGMAVDEFLYIAKYEANIPTTDWVSYEGVDN